MRKNGRAIVFALLLLLVPVLANAWTLTTRVYGPSSAGEVVIQAGDATGAVLKTINAGVEYVQVPNGTDAYVTYTTNDANMAANVLVDYASVTAPYTIAGNSGNHQLSVYFATAADKKGDVSVTKAAGGTVVLQYNGGSSMTGFTGLVFGSTVGVKASPRADYKVTSITVADASTGSTTYTIADFGAAVAGQAKTIGFQVVGTEMTVTAAYELVANARAMLSAPLRAVTDKAVTLSATGTTANAAVTYEFVVGGSVAQNNTSQTYSFIPAVGGPLAVTLNVKSGDTVLATKTATINVVSEAVAYNDLCLGCHTGSTPAIVNAYKAGIYSTTPCTSCHTTAPHGNFDSTDSGFDHGTGAVAEPTIEGCVQCHSDVETEWKTSTHYNANTYPYDRGETSSCYACHAPGGERIITDPSTTIAAAVVGCTGCHGNDMAVPANVQATCGSCHYKANHVDSAAWDIPSKVAASRHGDADLTYGNREKCSRCHSYQGSVQFADRIGDADYWAGVADPSYPAGTQNVTCAGCHDPHTGGLRTIAGWDPNNNGVADQFDLCTSCHNYYLDGMLVGGGSTVGDYANTTAPFYHNTSWYRTVTSTHYDNPATGYGLTTNQIEGYVIRVNGDNPCFDCHGHELRTNTQNAKALDGTTAAKKPTNHNQWAKSAHAGGLLSAKFAAYDAIAATGEQNAAVKLDYLMNHGVEDAPIGNAWVHYNWDASNRAACQKCHTATGLANFLDAAAAGTAYSSAANDFSHLAGWNNDTTGSGQNELLYCWGCHSSVETGALRATGAIKLDYLVDGAEKSLTAPDGNSAACLSCHTGRGNLNTLLGAATLDPTAAAISSPGTKSHYLAAGLTVNQAQVNAGYTFGLDYADKSYFKHNTIGCAECHMSSGEKSHSFNVVEKDETTGVITAIMGENCVTCHTGKNALFVAASQVGTTQLIWDGTAAVETVVTQQMADDAAAELEHESHGFHAALAVLEEVFAANGILTSPNYPYFTGAAPANQGQSGAMYNYSYLHHEPGAFAHNRYLAKRLIWDSIDWMDNGALDNSVPTATAGNADAAGWLGSVRP